MLEGVHPLGWMIVAVVLADISSGGILKRNCQCVPDQWQGILASMEREFDLTGGRTGSSQNYLYITYDYLNKKFAMTDLKTGNRAVADYNRNFKYVIRNGHCRGLYTEEAMRQMCLPEHATHEGEFRLGAVDVPVDVWQFNGPFNVSMKTTVIQKNCVPVTEEVYMAKGNFASLTSSMYLDVNIGIRDETVFKLPEDCPTEHEEREENSILSEKRADGSWSLMHMLKNSLAHHHEG